MITSAKLYHALRDESNNHWYLTFSLTFLPQMEILLCHLMTSFFLFIDHRSVSDAVGNLFHISINES